MYTFNDTEVSPGHTYKYALNVIDQANKDTLIPIVQDYKSIEENQRLIFTLFIVTSILGVFAVTSSPIIVLKK